MNVPVRKRPSAWHFLFAPHRQLLCIWSHTTQVASSNLLLRKHVGLDNTCALKLQGLMTRHFSYSSVGSIQEIEAMEQAMRDGEGCNIEGWLDVLRVAGNFHVSVHSQVGT